MGQLVVNGALCKCTMGLAPCSLTFLPLHRTTGSKQPVGTIMDRIPFLNIFGFSLCNSLANPIVAAATAAKFGVFTPAACLPTLPAPWIPGTLKTKIGKIPALDSNSVLNCVYGGVISISFAGQATISVN